MIEFIRRADDLRLPEKVMVHDLAICDFIFKSIDLEIELAQTKRSAGMLLKAITDNCDKQTTSRVILGHMKLMQDADEDV